MTWIILIDRSEKPREQLSFVSIVIINDSFLAGVYSQIKDWIVPTKKLGKKKARYFNMFENRYSKILHFVEVSRVFSYMKGRSIPDVIFEIVDRYFQDHTILEKIWK